MEVSVNATQGSFSNPRQNRPICSHCGYTGHTIDKYYKVHGYPPGFNHKNKQKIQAEKPIYSAKQSSYAKPHVSQLTLSTEDPFPNMVNNLSKDQIHGVIAYFNSQLQTSSAQQHYVASTSGGTITALLGMAFSSSTLCFVGILKAMRNVLSSQSWSIDSGATHHVSHDRSLFGEFSDSLNRSVTLPT